MHPATVPLAQYLFSFLFWPSFSLVRITLFTLMRIRIRLFTLMLIRILLLIKAIQICDHWSTQNLHSSILNILASIVSVHGPFEPPPQLLNFEFDADPAFDFDLDLGPYEDYAWDSSFGFSREPLPFFFDPEKNSIKQCCGSGSGIRDWVLFDPWIRDPE